MTTKKLNHHIYQLFQHSRGFGLPNFEQYEIDTLMDGLGFPAETPEEDLRARDSFGDIPLKSFDALKVSMSKEKIQAVLCHIDVELIQRAYALAYPVAS